MQLPQTAASPTSLLLANGRKWRLSRTAQNWIRIVLVLSVVIYVVRLYFYYSPPNIVIDESYVQHIDEDAANNVLLEKVCSPTTTICYSVVDVIDQQELVLRKSIRLLTLRFRLTAKRAVYLHGFEHEYDTLVRLIPPKGKTVMDSDTRMWAVNHSAIESQYIAAMIVAPLMTSSIPLAAGTRDATTDMVVVGLGGGSLDMFYHHHRPEINITVYEMDPLIRLLAHKWFGVVDDATRRTVVQDGVHAIHEAVVKKQFFDAIFIDACDTTHEIPCPAPAFVTPATLRAIKSVLKPMGTVVFNVLPLEHEEENVQMMRHRLMLEFPTCLTFRMPMELNAVFACTPYHIEPSNVAATKRIMKDRLVEIKQTFGFQHVLKDVESMLNA
ncbi:Protein Y34B4A.7 [Aphelenchoides avenae]|nr:Protein Y34B4A.7 [Aphelenchus avenae]